MFTDVTLPEVSENVKAATVVKILVAPGDSIAAEQPLLEVETEKAMFELPSPGAGTVAEILVEPGDQVAVGQVLLRLETSAGSEEVRKLVGEEGPFPAPASPALSTSPSIPQGPSPDPSLRIPNSEFRISPPPLPAAPSVRRLARELGVDLYAVRGTGPKGRISALDVKEHARALLDNKASPAAFPATRPLPDFAKWGPVRREPLSTVRRITAEAMAHAWSAVPRVTHYDRADIAELEAFRAKHAREAEAAGGKLTVTAVLLQVVAAALRRFPPFNASIDVPQGEVVFKEYVHVGVAVDTDRGLLVPVVRDADKKSLTQLAAELASLAEKARTRRLMPDEMEGGTFTISNLGGIGGTGFSPIVYWPQVAILGVSRAEVAPVWREGQFQPRLMLPLSLSYDHRIIDGADGARFLRWVCETLQWPWNLLL